MDRQPPRTTSEEIDLYIRTYYSLLRSSGEVRVRAFEESHAHSNSSLHLGAKDVLPDLAAFAYSAARLPACMHRVRRVIMGQSHEHFEAAELSVRDFDRVQTRGRRRPLRWDGDATLAAFVTSISDIDDLIPILTAYQIEWNKLHALFAQSELGRTLAAQPDDAPLAIGAAELERALSIDPSGVLTLMAALGESLVPGLREIARRESDLRVRLLAGSYTQYQRAAQRWWSGIEPHYVREARPRRQPIYFVSSNSHAIINLLGGYARLHRESLLRFAQECNPEQLAERVDAAMQSGDEARVSNLLYYLLRAYLHHGGGTHLRKEVQDFDGQSGIVSIDIPGHIDVSAQLIEISRLHAERADMRVRMPGFEKLRDSDAVILNIDYPLGMAAYHHLSRVAQGAGELRGVYLMGKAATLNARVGDVMISSVVHDEHSQNTYLFRNCFTAAHVQPYLDESTVLDSQKALTVRSTFLQNRDYMSVFYKEGYTVLEMEAGPYLSAIYEIVNPNRHPKNEIVNLSATPFELGILHYASDTPYSRRQSLLSKSLSYFGVESTYACAIAIVDRILKSEIARFT